ncbi:hypothetical protein B7494_g1346 [Chlorociboria aeruginascens]|nr:hypothetical protein B7494_g1346 [Chlorociboria aeruginascens]
MATHGMGLVASDAPLLTHQTSAPGPWGGPAGWLTNGSTSWIGERHGGRRKEEGEPLAPIRVSLRSLYTRLVRNARPIPDPVLSCDDYLYPSALDAELIVGSSATTKVRKEESKEKRRKEKQGENQTNIDTRRTTPPSIPQMTPSETCHPAFDEPPSSKVSYRAAVGTLVSPNVSYGLPYTEACAQHVKKTFTAQRVYIICSGTLSRETDNLQRLVAALEASGIKVVGVKKGMRSHTPWSQIIEITNEARAGKADCLVTLGGGSLTDGAKIAVLALANDLTEPSQLARYSVEATDPILDVKPPTIPLICIPTSLSGGEYFALAGGTDDIVTKHKQAFLHGGMGVSLIILDAELCLGTPRYHWLSTGVRSVDHCVEALCSLEATPASDEAAEAGLRLLIPWLLQTQADEFNVEARHQCQMGVRFAMRNVRAGIPMGGSHAIGHQLGPMGVAHGVTSCIMCPEVMKWNIAHGHGIPEIQKKQDKIRDILWSENAIAQEFTKAGLTQQDADLGDLLDAIIRALGLPRTLKEVGIGQDQIDTLSKRTLDDAWASTNPIPLTTAAQVKSILETVVG